MASENKKLALLRILEILQENTDCDHIEAENLPKVTAMMFLNCFTCIFRATMK